MFNNKGHGFLCRCDVCKNKRKNSLFYMGFLVFLFIILLWQLLFTIIITTRFNVFLILVLFVMLFIGLFRIIF